MDGRSPALVGVLSRLRPAAVVVAAAVALFGAGGVHAAPLGGSNTWLDWTAGGSHCADLGLTSPQCDTSGIYFPAGTSGNFFPLGDLGSTYNGDAVYVTVVAGTEADGSSSGEPEVLDCSDSGFTSCTGMGTFSGWPGEVTWTLGSNSHHFLLIRDNNVGGNGVISHFKVTYTPAGGGSGGGDGGGGSGGSGGTITFPTIDMGAISANVGGFFGFLSPVLWLIGGISIGGLLLHKARGLM